MGGDEQKILSHFLNPRLAKRLGPYQFGQSYYSFFFCLFCWLNPGNKFQVLQSSAHNLLFLLHLWAAAGFNSLLSHWGPFLQMRHISIPLCSCSFFFFLNISYSSLYVSMITTCKYHNLVFLSVLFNRKYLCFLYVYLFINVVLFLLCGWICGAKP